MQTVAPAAEKRPAVHARQADRSGDITVPARHCAHTVFPVPDARCPFGHGWHDEAGAGPNVPAGHTTHAVLSELAWEPAPHGVHVPDPDS